jgi:hypothetical protein
MAAWLPNHGRLLQLLGQEHGLVLREKKLVTVADLRVAMNSERQLLDRYRASCLLGIVQFGWDAFMQTHRYIDTPTHRHSGILTFRHIHRHTHIHSITCISFCNSCFAALHLLAHSCMRSHISSDCLFATRTSLTEPRIWLPPAGWCCRRPRGW